MPDEYGTAAAPAPRFFLWRRERSVVYDCFARFDDLAYSFKEDDLPFYLDLADRTGDPVLDIGAGK